MRISDIVFSIIVIFFISLFAYLLYSNFLMPNPSGGVERKALIIDTVEDIEPNPKLIKEIKSLLTKAGYNTTICSSENATVDFFKKIYIYDVIIMRVHSTITTTPLQFLPNNSVAIITGEKYRKDKYIVDQLAERLLPSSLLPQTGIAYGYFAFTGLFISNYIPRFRNSTVIVMGCHSLYSKDMAQAFISKGAKVYIGWDNYVTPTHMDKALYKLIYYLFVEKKSVGEAVSRTMMEIGRDPDYGAQLKFYPLEAYDYKPLSSS